MHCKKYRLHIAKKIAAQNLSSKQQTICDKLSPRELSVAKLTGQCKKLADIALLLDADSKTVDSFRYRIFAKFNTKGNTALARLVIEYGLVENE